MHVTFFFYYTTTIIVVAPASAKAILAKVQKTLLQRKIFLERYFK